MVHVFVICSSKKPRLDQVPAASLDADDPLDSEDSSDEDSDDDLQALLAEVTRIKKERASENTRRVGITLAIDIETLMQYLLL